MRPLNSYVLVEKIDEELKTSGGLFMPVSKSPSQKVSRGKVIAVSNDCEDLSVGDFIIYNRYAEHDIGIDDDYYKNKTLVRLEDIEATYGE